MALYVKGTSLAIMKFNDQQAEKIGKEVQGLVKGKAFFDPFSRGRYSTDSSLYQIKPIGAVLPKDHNDVLRLMEYSQKKFNSFTSKRRWKLTMRTNCK